MYVQVDKFLTLKRELDNIMALNKVRALVLRVLRVSFLRLEVQHSHATMIQPVKQTLSRLQLPSL